jgi:streptogramin lyase
VVLPSGGGPAFLAYNDDKVYYSLWITNRLGEYDVVTQRFTEYGYLAGETGGPLFMAPNGKVVVGTRNRGYIVVFDPASKTFQNYQIPTATPGLKDGLTVAQDGAIWFTESGQQKIARLVLP